MQKIIIVICISLTAIISVSAQNVSRGFKNYEKKEFDKAKELFEKILEDEPANVAANCGLGMIYGNDEYPGFDYFMAWKHMSLADKNFNSLSPEDEEAIAEFFYNLETRKSNRSTRKKFDIHKIIIEEKLIKYVREEKDLDMVTKFIDEFPDSRFHQNVVHIRNYLEFREVEKKNTIEGFEGFIKRFPDAAQIPKAIRTIHKLAFAKAKSIHTIQAYIDFINKYPEAKEVESAMQNRDHLAFLDAKKINTVESFEKFILNYPKALDIPQAEKLRMGLLFERAKSINTLEAYNEFVAMYPEGEYFIDIFYLKSKALGEQFIKFSKLQLSDLQWTIGLDNNNQQDFGTHIAIGNQGILVAAQSVIPDSASTAWILLLTENGKMVWNKTYGNPLENYIHAVCFSGNKDMFFGGYQTILPDSSAKKSWLLKLNPDGFVYWSKKIDPVEILTLDINTNDEIMVGGYVLDSLNQRRYALGKYKTTRKRLWFRQYLSMGAIHDLKITPDNSIIAAGGNWYFKSDKEGYLQWDHFLQPGDSVLTMDMDVNGDIVFAGITAQKAPWLARIDGNSGTIIWRKNIAQPNMIPTSLCMGNNKILVGGNIQNNGWLAKMDINGNEIWNKTISTGKIERIESIAKSNSGFFVLLTSVDFINSNIVILKISF